MSENIQSPISWSYISRGYEDHVNQGPHSESSEAEQLPDAFSPEPQVEPISTESTQSHTETGKNSPEKLIQLWNILLDWWQITSFS